MVDRLDYLFQEWHRLAGAVMLSETDDNIQARRAEKVIAESTSYCRASGRLMWVVLGWLIRHIEEIDEEKLLQETKQCGNLAVLGVLCDAAQLRNPHSKFARIVADCTKPDKIEPFFHRVACSPLALRLTQENALDVFRRWNYLCSELRYL